MARDILIKPNRGSTGSNVFPEIQFNGLSASSIKLRVDDDGSVVYTGTYGALFNISDNKDGLLHSVNDVSGLPILQVYSYDYVQMGKWDSNTLVVNSDKVGIGMTGPTFSLDVQGTLAVKSGTTSWGNTGTGQRALLAALNATSSSTNNAVAFFNYTPQLTSALSVSNQAVTNRLNWPGNGSFATISSATVNLRALNNQVVISATYGNIVSSHGVNSTYGNLGTGSTVQFFWSYVADIANAHAGTTNVWGAYYVPDQTSITGNGKPGTFSRWGVRIEDPSNNYFAGRVGIGTGQTSPTIELQVAGTSSTTALRVTGGAVAGYTLVSDASGNATWTNPGSTGLTGSVTTTNATSTLMVGCSASIPTGNAMTAWAYVIGKSPSGATSAVGGRVEGVFRNVAGVLTSVGVSSNVVEDFSSGNPSFTLVSSGTFVTVQVTGFVGATISWYGTMKYNII